MEPSHRTTSPLDNASILSQIFMYWMRPLLVSVKRGDVSEACLTALPKVVDLEGHTIALKKALMKQKKVSFLRALWSVFGGLFFRWGCPQFVAMVGQLGIALIVSDLIMWLKNPDDPDWYGYMLATMMLIVSLAVAVCNNYVVMRFFILGGSIKQTCLQVLYDKTLRLSLHSLQKTSAGKLINLVASDFDMFEYMIPIVQLMYLPLYLAIAGGFLWMKLERAGLLALAITLVQLPLQRLVSSMLVRVRRQIAEATDARLKLLNNMIEGVKLIKLYAWEVPLSMMITRARHKEYMNILKKYMIRLVWFTIFSGGHGVTFLFAFWVYVELGNELKISDLMGAMTIILSLQFYVNFTGSYAIDQLAYMHVSSQRMSSVLSLPEMTEQRGQTTGEYAVEVENLSASWSDMESKATKTESKERLMRTSEEVANCTLEECTFKVTQGELCMVVGPVGSGKSSLLLALMSELKYVDGSVKVAGNCAYVEQEPWIISATVRENILMGKTLDQSRYDRVVKSCCLLEDFGSMMHGDLTHIGDRGINLSGGQKARIALARAVYSDSDIYLLDDPLSAVDAHVGVELFEKCISGTLKSKTRLLVTHQTQYLPKANMIVVMRQGTIIAVGTYNELLQNPQCRDVFESYQKHEEEEKEIIAKQEVMVEESVVKEKKQDIKSIVEEERSSGSVPFSLYISYLHGAFDTYWVFLGFLVVSLAVILPYLAIPFWLQYWATQTADEQQNLYYVEVVGLIVLGLLVASVIRNGFIYMSMLKASKHTHNRAVQAIVQTTATFFDANPSGRIMNRLSRDVSLMDDQLTLYVSDLLQYVFMVGGYVIVIIVLNPYTLIALAAVVAIVVFLVKKIVPVARDIRRLELISKSPIFSLLTQSIGGLPTVRAFSLSTNLMQEMSKLATMNLRAFFHFQAQMRVFQMYTDYSCVILIVVNSYVVVALKGSIDANTIGIGMSFSVVILSLMTFMCKFAVETENVMTCTQRLVDYTKLQPEGDYRKEKFAITEGAIEFRNVFMKYREHLEYVLKDLSFSIAPRTKVGIVGRTGAGKSSLLQVLFRLVPISEGLISIDGVDISSLGLHDLRKELSVIPQSPFIFQGTVRENLDPFKERTEEEVWAALEAVELFNYFSGLSNKLETVLSGSVALSVGQKQLMCLARAILRKNKVLVMDEATANVDKMTDALIQKKIRELFHDCTILTIAHRLKTVIDYDLILLMSQGGCLELDSPANLLSRDSEFSRMVEATGPEESQLLRKLAIS